MDISFTIKYTSGSKDFDGLDQYYGALSLFGVSQALLISLNAFFNKEVITQAPSAKGFRLVLGPSKRGSWEQVIQLVITDPQVQTVLGDLGKNALYDLIKYVVGGSVGIPFVVLKHRKSRKRMRDLERENDDLQEKLDDALRRAHAPVKHQGLNIHIMGGRTVLVTFNEETLQFIETEVVSEETEIVRCAISRYNTRTGTGRMIVDLDAVSVPFIPVDRPVKAYNSVLADSLAQLARDRFSPVEAVVSPITDGAGRIKRYRLHRLLGREGR